MSEILDDFAAPEQVYYAKNAYRLFVITTIFFVLPLSILLFFPAFQQEGSVFPFLGGVSLLITLFTSFTGFAYGIKSFIKKETSSKKYIGTIGNFLFVVLWILLFIANLMDLNRFLNS